MVENLKRSFGLVYSQPVLLALVDSGYSRDEAYRITQRNAMAAWESKSDFKELLLLDPEMKLRREELDEVMEPKRALKNVGSVFLELDGIEERI